MTSDYVPGEADWLELVRREVLTDDDLRKFKPFNPNGNRRFWWWVLKAFRELEDASGTEPAMRSAELYAEVNKVREHSRQQLRASSPNLYKAIKEIGKAITRINRQYRQDAERCAAAAEAELSQITRSHVVIPLLRPPIEEHRLEAAKQFLEKQRADIDQMPKPPKLKGRENKYENVFRAIVHLAVAYRISGGRLTFGLDGRSETSFPALLSVFYRVARCNLLNAPIQKKEEGFQYYARDHAPRILASVKVLKAN